MMQRVSDGDGVALVRDNDADVEPGLMRLVVRSVRQSPNRDLGSVVVGHLRCPTFESYSASETDMNDQTLTMLGVAALVVGLIAVGVWAAGMRRRIAEAYASFAAAHGLDHTEGSRHVAGDIDGGRSFALFQDVARGIGGYERRNQARQVPALLVRVELATPAPDKLTIDKKGMLSGSSPIQTGDAEFDKKVYVTCPDGEAASRWLGTPERRAAVLKAVTTLKAGILGPVPDGTTHDGQPADRPMLYRRWESGYKAKQEWFEARFQEFTDLARQIDEGAPATP